MSRRQHNASAGRAWQRLARALRFGSGGVAGLLLLAAAMAEASSPTAWTLQLDHGPPEAWPRALEALLARDKGLPPKAAASVLRRESILDPAQRLRLVERLSHRRLTRDPRVVAYLERQAGTARPAIATAARKGLFDSSHPAAVDALVRLHAQRPDWRRAITLRLLARYTHQIDERFRRLHGRGLYPHDAAVLAAGGRRDQAYWPVFQAGAGSADADLRYRLADRLRYSADTRTDALLWDLARDGDADVALKALWSLTRRRNAPACTTVLKTFWDAPDPRLDDAIRREHLKDTGIVCAATHLPQIIERVARAPESRQPDAAALLSGVRRAAMLPQLRSADDRDRLHDWTRHQHAGIRATASALLENWQQEQRELAREQQRPWLIRAGLLMLSLLSALLGLTLFLWGFRLIQLLRLLGRLAPVPIASAALGTSLLRGRLVISDTGTIAHPVSGEECLYYAGAETDWPRQHFLLEDSSGRLLVDPRGAVLLSADDVLVENEAVWILGYLSPGTGEERVLAKDRPRRSLAGRALHFCVQGLLGLWDRSGQGRALFSDPLRCFWIWDDADAPPLSGRLELARLLLVFLLAGAWITVFGLIAMELVA